MFTPRTRSEIAEAALGALISRAGLTDTHKGSVLHTLAHAIAAVSASTERQIEAARAAFDFREAAGAELDARLSELPLSTISRLSATPARGVLVVTLSALTSPLTIEEGATFSASAHPEQLYITTEAHTIPAGETRAEIAIEATTGGSAGNLPAGAVDTLTDAPAALTSCTNPAPLAGGLDGEGDSSLKRRAGLYLQSLARSQPAALEYLAYTHSSSAGRVILASLYEPPEVPGYSALYIDDGTGRLDSSTRPGLIYTGTAPAGLSVIYHEAPALASPRVIVTATDGSERTLGPAEVLGVEERGALYIAEGAISEGESYTLGPYEVYTGLIAELQAEIEGDMSAPTASQGWRAAGTRVQVQPARAYALNLDLSLIIAPGYDMSDITATLTRALQELTYELRIGAPLYASRVICAAMQTEGIISARPLVAGTGGTPAEQPLGDVYPPPNRVIRLGALTLTPTTEET